MNKNRKEYQKHLTLSDRIYIEQGLLQKKSFKEIADFLYKDPSTISKEVQRSLEISRGFARRCEICKYYKACTKHQVCGDKNCMRRCKACYQKNVQEECESFYPFQCTKRDKAPYACNGCDIRRDCPLEKHLYDAKHAQRKYEKRLSDSRKGISLTVEELAALDALITPLVQKGQPLSHIFATHQDEIPCCRRTLYNYFDRRILTAKNIDLPRRVRYRKRKRKRAPSDKILNGAYRNGRTYKDFERFMEKHPDLDVIELDTVLGRQGTKKRLLTMLFRKSHFMLVFLIPDGKQESVIRVLDDLTQKLTLPVFKKYFPVILTDNGSEFKLPERMEETVNGEKRTRVFYCDPFISGQKGRLEKNHEFIRYVIPKGRSLVKYTQDDINLMTSHINSTARDGLNGMTPFDMAELLLDKRIPAIAGQFKVSPDEVMLKPELINR
jgi:IS30 family transposase